MTKRLLLFNLRTDADDAVLGFTTQWINALAAHYDAVDVITMHAGRIAVANNVHVMSAGREKGIPLPLRLLRFYALLIGCLMQHRYTACFAHMQPLFAAMAGPLLTLRGIPLTTWYTHRQRTRQLEAALFMSRRVVTAVPDSFPIPTPKLRVTGHGIDTDFYTPPAAPSSEHLIAQVARLTPIKNQAALLQASVSLDAQIALIGDVPDGFAADYERELKALAPTLGLQERVCFTGAQTPAQVREWYHRAMVAVNFSPPGLFDKAALEGMACGVPTLTSNPAFAPLLDGDDRLQTAWPLSIPELTAKLQTLLALPADERRAIGTRLRAQVMAQHSLEALIQRLISILETGEF
jgi:glycosyltransferase involved in cell wall biosynthesis